MKNIFKLHYHIELLVEMLKGTKSGAISSNIVGGMVVAYTLYGLVPFSVVLGWLALQLTIFSLRFVTHNNLSHAIKEDKYRIQKHFKWYIAMSSATALSYGSIVLFMALYGVEIEKLLVITMVIFALTAGSIATLGVVHVAFVLYMFLNLFPLTIALLIHGGDTAFLIALIVFIYFVMHTISGYRLFLNNQGMVVLQHKFKTLYEKSSDGIALIKNRSIIDSNEAIFDMFGFSKESKDSFLRRDIIKFSPEKQPNGKNSLRQMLKYLRKGEREIVNFEWQHEREDGTLFWVEITLVPLAINKEEIVQGIWRNIDDRKKAEQEVLELNETLENRVQEELEKNRIKQEQLIQQSRMAQMGEMLSMIAHQWRQPLGSIGSVIASLKLQIALDDYDMTTFNEDLEDIESYISHLSQTIDDFRNFYKPNKSSEYTTTTEIVKKSLAIIKGSFFEDNIAVEQHHNSNVKHEMYGSEMIQVILNIFKNAQDNFREKKIEAKQITITTTDDSICIEDNGGGIDEAVLPTIFDPYFSTKNEKNGTGLGLYMSKTIVEEHHHGQLIAYNQNDGICFEIDFLPNKFNEVTA